MADPSPGIPDKNRKQKKSFKLPQLTETQWAVVGSAVFLIIYLAYSFVPAMLASSGNNNIGLTAQIEARQVETEEERFKRENKNITLPDGSAMPAHVVEQNTKLTQQVPFGDRELEFRVRLPSNWVLSDFARYGLPGQDNYAVLTNIARYFGPAIEDTRPYLWVEVERLKRYTSAETWARAYMIKRGISPEALVVKSQTEVEALYVDVRDLRSFAVRALFRIEGDTMVMTSFGVPVSNYKDFKDIMGLTLNSFHLIRPINKQIEEIKSYKLLNVLDFRHYAAWLPENAYLESTLHPAVELHNPQQYNNPKEDLLQGLILVNAWRKSPQFPPGNNMGEIIKRLEKSRMTLKDPLMKTKIFPARKGYDSISQTAYLAQVDTYVRKDQFDIVKSEESKTMQEVWITILDNDYYMAYITLVTPLRATNYVLWAQNIAAYDLLLKSLHMRGPSQDD